MDHQARTHTRRAHTRHMGNSEDQHYRPPRASDHRGPWPRRGGPEASLPTCPSPCLRSGFTTSSCWCGSRLVPQGTACSLDAPRPLFLLLGLLRRRALGRPPPSATPSALLSLLRPVLGSRALSLPRGDPLAHPLHSLRVTCPPEGCSGRPPGLPTASVLTRVSTADPPCPVQAASSGPPPSSAHLPRGLCHRSPLCAPCPSAPADVLPLPPKDTVLLGPPPPACRHAWKGLSSFPPAPTRPRSRPPLPAVQGPVCPSLHLGARDFAPVPCPACALDPQAPAPTPHWPVSSDGAPLLPDTPPHELDLGPPQLILSTTDFYPPWSS